ncbi:tyrosine-type recombinase/integrase [Chloroflexia bacterium SDU3-3]|nr:tyrosine-type recombinase/integrase [Chloroflexia bacterium SDU3-3]
MRGRCVGARVPQGRSPHSLRHSFVTLAIRGGASVAQAQAAARHKDPRTTMRYAHDLQNLDDNAVDDVKF